ncbi:MAG: ABC transporter ATP-binding protein [Gammaproteobacteria bacterium]
MNDAAVVIKNVCKHYGDLAALDDVSMTVGRGEFFGLLGPNGAGKTTLIGVLGGLIKADSGKAVIMDSDVRADALAARRKVGIVTQELLYDPFFTVREALVFQAKYYGLGGDRKWIDTLLERLNLGAQQNTNTRNLSGGMKRRLMIAQALVHRPPVIVLDEPTAGVDINLRLSLWGFIRELNNDGHTIILTTHYLEEAEALCRKLALMRGGKVVALDDTRNLLGGCVQVRLLAEGKLPDNLPPHRRRESGRMIFNTLNYDDIEPLLASLRQSGARIVDLEVAPADLEDAFLRIVGAPQ